MGGKIYLIGGFDHKEHVGGRGPALSTVDVYDTRTRTWHASAEIPTPRIGPRAAVFSNEIYVFEGYDYKGPWGVKRYHKTVEVYDTQTDTWAKKHDQIWVFNRCRFTPHTKFKNDAKTVALWHFDEPSRTRTFSDTSGNAYHLIGKNGAKTEGEFAAVEAEGKLATIWERLKR